MNWIVEHVEDIVIVMGALTFTAIVVAIVFGRTMNAGPSMMHENETQEPREWRSANWKPLNEKETK